MGPSSSSASASAFAAASLLLFASHCAPAESTESAVLRLGFHAGASMALNCFSATVWPSNAILIFTCLPMRVTVSCGMFSLTCHGESKRSAQLGMRPLPIFHPQKSYQIKKYQMPLFHFVAFFFSTDFYVLAVFQLLKKRKCKVDSTLWVFFAALCFS